MLQIVLGPVLFAFGVLIIYGAINGLPSGMDLSRLKPAARPASRKVPPADALVVEMLTEMLNLREQLTVLQDQVGTLKTRQPRKATRTRTAIAVR